MGNENGKWQLYWITWGDGIAFFRENPIFFLIFIILGKWSS